MTQPQDIAYISYVPREDDETDSPPKFVNQGFEEIGTIVHFAVCHRETNVCEVDLPSNATHASVVHVGSKKGSHSQEWMLEEKSRKVRLEECQECADGETAHLTLPNCQSLLELRKGFEQGAVLLDLEADDLQKTVCSVVDAWVAQMHLSAEQKATVIKALLLSDRSDGALPAVNGIGNDTKSRPEATMSLIGTSLAFLDSPIAAFVRLAEPKMFGNPGDVYVPVRFLFIMLSPEPVNYVEMGRGITALMVNPEFQEAAYQANDREYLIKAMDAYMEGSVALPPSEFSRKTLLPFLRSANEKHREKISAKKAAKEAEVCIEEGEKKGKGVNPLARTGRLFGGMINDIKRRYPYYWSDIRDGLNFQCVSVIIFIYFACLSPAITYGSLLGDFTGQMIGISEMLMMSGLCGIIFSLLSCQPIVIIGATGPVVVFERALVSICEGLEIEYLPTRCWVGIWVAVIAVALTMFDGSALVGYITRFVEEIYSVLVSFIYIIEVFFKLGSIFDYHPLQWYYATPAPPLDLNYTTTPGHSDHNTTGLPEDDYEKQQVYPNTALFSCLLCFSTFFIAFYMKKFRNSHFLGRTVRRTLGDFGVPIAIVIMVLVDALWVRNVYTEKLLVPGGFAITSPEKRDFFINPMGKNLPLWVIGFSAVVAMLAFILIFINTQVCAMIVNKPERKLKKGGGYHMDMLLVGCFGVIAGLFGFPLVNGATVRGVTHISACTITETNKKGTNVTVGVYEQRFTNFVVHVLLLFSVFLGPVLRLIPYAVLYGIFLYMGVASLMGVQMCERIVLLFMPQKYHWDSIYNRHVPVWKMHIWTVIQVVSVAVLWGVQLTPAALSFPFILILLVPIRLNIFKYLWTKHERQHLDNKGKDPHEGEAEPDFYEQAFNLPTDVDWD